MDTPNNVAAQAFEKIAFQASQVFTPSQPILNDALFSGRLMQIRTIVDAVNQPGQHAILYGERGVGKTSLANVLATFLRGYATVIAPRIGCFSTDTYSDLWRKAFNEIRFTTEQPSIGYREQIKTVASTFASQLPEMISHDVVRSALTQLGANHVTTVLIFDEFDTLASPETRKAMAETVKLLSDYSVPATLVLVGVADSVSGLLEDHKSVERAMVQVRMPRMSDQELREIIDKGAAQLDVTFDPQAASMITALSRGLPHYTHLLSLYAVREAVDDQSNVIQDGHVRRAIDTAIRNTQQSTIEAYDKATASSQKNNIFREVLLACAQAETDELGYFTPAAVRDPLSRIKKKIYEIPAFVGHLHQLSEEPRGSILQRIGVPRRHRFRFSNPIMQPFVLLRGVADRNARG